MAAPYTVEIQGTSDLTLTAPSVEYRTVARTHRENVHPRVLARVTYEVTIGFRVEGASSVATVTALGNVVQNYLDKRVLPTYVKIKDSAGDVVDEIGQIDTGNGWEDFEFADFQIPPPSVDEPGQWKAYVRGVIVLRASRVYPDANGVCEFSQNYEEGADVGGLTFKRVVTDLRLSESSGSSLATLVTSGSYTIRLPAPVGWVRVPPTNGSIGVHVRYPDYPRSKHLVITSHVQEVGGTVVPPAGSTQAPETEEIREDFARGVKRVTLRVESSGGDQTLEYVEGKRPGDDIGTTIEDRSTPAAQGVYSKLEELLTAYPDDTTVTQVTQALTLSGGGRRTVVTRMTRGIPPKVRIGPLLEWRLEERLDVYALGPREITELNLNGSTNIPGGPAGQWVEDASARVDSLPTIEEHGAAPSQHLVRRTLARVWTWVGNGTPWEDLRFVTWAGRMLRGEQRVSGGDTEVPLNPEFPRG